MTEPLAPSHPEAHAGRIRQRECARVETDQLESVAAALFADGFRLASVAGHDDGDHIRVIYVFLSGPPDARIELQVLLDAARPVLPSLAAHSFPASRFERELQDLFGVVVVGHPSPDPLVRHQHWPTSWHPMRRDAGPAPAMRDDAPGYPFLAVDGPGVYEIPVGPVHAGLIEPGHFRFSVVGETILSMEARLWFVHRGVERLFEGRPASDGVAIAERISGDTAVGHNLAFCLAVEEAQGVEVSQKSALVRAVLLELERVYNHVADIGALCNDVGFGLAQARALVLREQLLRLNAEVTGHRLLRGAIQPGGASVRRMPGPAELGEVRAAFEDLVALATTNTVVADRFKGTAALSRDAAEQLGVLGVVARASGLSRDARLDHPFVGHSAAFRVETATSGDVWARFVVRASEIRTSLSMIDELVAETERASDRPSVVPRGPGVSGLGIVEGWRGAIVHRVELAADDRVRRCKVVDPSFLNWPALSVSLADTIVPDFPLANKSFNLSYAGNDL
jgi:Ni,Fe-hydrogenase III large subunit/Ni,Fe-hydrogenase III component G